jgi:hypothetical protein
MKSAIHSLGKRLLEPLLRFDFSLRADVLSRIKKHVL